MIDLIDKTEVFFKGIVAIYLISWSFMAVVILPVISLGSFKHIIFIDKQLAKDLDKLYDHNGYMRSKYQLSWEIVRRFNRYCVSYPFIRNRVITNSVKFKVFMWINALGYWCLISVLFWTFIEKGLGSSF